MYVFSPKLADRWVFADFRRTCQAVLNLFGVKVEVVGNTENLNLNEDAVCYFANHTSFLDICALGAACKLKAGYIAKKELMFMPFVNLAIKALHGVYVDRKNLKKSVESVNKAAENVKKGHHLVVFPEGTRSKTGVIAPFKRGSFRLATKSGAAMVPLVIKGLRSALEDRKRVFVRTSAKVYVGNVYRVKNCKTRDEQNELCESLEKDVNKIYNNL